MQASQQLDKAQAERQSIKCVIWDLDNTIWDGILLEDDQVHLRAGVAETLEELDRRGILLSIASRNDHELAMAKLIELGIQDYFLYPKINWNTKSSSIQAISKALNIGLDTFAFVDDQPFEREEVQFEIPVVLCIDAADINTMLDMPAIRPRFITQESKLRRHMYRNDITRQEAEDEFSGTSEEFLAQLGMVFKIKRAQEEDLQRAEELTLRTNQLNTTGYTYSYDELNALCQSPDHLLLVASLDDKYGAYGSIGLALVETGETFWTVKLLLMSCRVMSRGVGSVMLHYIMSKAQEANARLRAEFISNGRNRMMLVTYRFNGFTEIDRVGDLAILEHELSQPIPPFPTYIQVATDASEPAPIEAPRPWQLLALSARTESALDAATQNLISYLRQHPEVDLADVTYTMQLDRTPLEFRRIAVCQGTEDALNILESKNSKRTRTRHAKRDTAPPVAFMFSGVGDQYPNLAHQLYEYEQHFRNTVDNCCDFLKPLLDVDLREVLFTKDTKSPARGSDPFRQMIKHSSGNLSSPLGQIEIAQPAVFVIEYALTQLLLAWGIHPNALVGHSLGEYTAACVAGVFSLEDMLTLVARRAQMIQQLPAGRMLAILLSEEEIQPFLSTDISLAIVNGPATCVLAGAVNALDTLSQHLTEQDITHRFLETSHAVHSHMMQPIAADLTALVQSMQRHAPRLPYLSNITGKWITAEESTDAQYWTRHLIQTVRFDANLTQLLQHGERILLEVGPGQSLGSFARQHPLFRREQVERILTTLPSKFDRQPDLAALLLTLGQLWLAAYPIEWQRLYSQERRRHLPLPADSIE